MGRRIRNSVKALVVREEKLLVVTIRDESGEWYILPGGGQEAEEALTETVCREVAEETGILVAARELVFVIEGVHGESFHRVDLVFSCAELGVAENSETVLDVNQAGYAWLDLSTLNTAPLYPSRLRRAIMNWHEGKPYLVYLGNEEIGDPEITD